MIRFNITLGWFWLAFIFVVILGILIVSQEFPCLFNHVFANPDFVYCDECGSAISSICPNGHRVDEDFCHVCGHTPVE